MPRAAYSGCHFGKIAFTAAPSAPLPPASEGQSNSSSRRPNESHFNWPNQRGNYTPSDSSATAHCRSPRYSLEEITVGMDLRPLTIRAIAFDSFRTNSYNPNPKSADKSPSDPFLSRFSTTRGQGQNLTRAFWRPGTPYDRLARIVLPT